MVVITLLDKYLVFGVQRLLFVGPGFERLNAADSAHSLATLPHTFYWIAVASATSFCRGVNLVPP